VLLSRIAESAYWAARYLERAEATARLVKAQTELILDLPLAAGVSWSPLLAVTGSGEEFLSRHADPAEEEIIAFLTADTEHPGSIVASLERARHDLRITRSLLPRTAWEEVNQLYLWATDTRFQAVDRRTRMEWMDRVIRRCHLLAGVVADTMLHDNCYSFLEIGRFVERADMTTRVLDVQSLILMGNAQGPVRPYADVTWMGSLRSLEAVQVLRAARLGTSGPEALRLLLKEPRFPRSVEHCLTRVSRSLIELPRSDQPMAACAELQQVLETVDLSAQSGDTLHEMVSELQDGIARLHELLTDTYFLVAPADSTVLVLK
jgi:uncharacterized alpha-E superfamily protein